MAMKGINWKMAWPITAAAFLSLSAQAENTITTGLATPEDINPTRQQEPADDDSPGFIRNHTWSGSFDRAGDATRDAELQLKKGVSFDCQEENFKGDDPTPQLLAQRVNECLQAQNEAQGFAKDAEGIRKMQRTFAHVSRVSDIAAVGAIGAVGYSELIKKDSSQASSLESVAKIQETAGYVSYATGAADISMGAYALAAQKSKLEKMKKALSSVTKSGVKLTPADSALVSKITNAAEQTKKAAVSHMAYGAGKVAVGYASMYLADKNKKIADSLNSLDTMNMPVNQSAGAPYVYKGSNGTAYYQNNNPEMVIPTDGSSTAGDNTAGPVSDSFSGAGGGASVMPSSEFRQPSSAGKGSGLGGLTAGGGPKGGESGAPEASAEAAPEDGAKPKESSDGALTLSGGGGSRYGGGAGTSEGGDAPVPQILESADARSSGTGVNPNSVYSAAMEGLDEDAQGSMAGVSGSGQTLFQVIKVKYNKMMEVGRLQGPGAVEVRN
jgi:hypothetical protein